jgi:hypothetical protein
MIKELFLAIALGALLGFGITGGYLALNQKSTSKNTPATITEPTVIPTISSNTAPTTAPSSQLSISSPEDNLLVSTSKLNIIGTTIANSHIVITTASKTFLGQSDNQGNFNIPIDLDSGLNIIKISSIDSTDSQLDSQLNITYSTTKI